MRARHHRSLLHAEHTFLHAVVRFDIENSRRARRNGRRQLRGGTFVGVTGFHQFAAAQRHHRSHRRAKVDVVALWQDDFVIFNRCNVQVFQQPVAVLNQDRGNRLGKARTGAGDYRRPFHLQQFRNVLTGFIHQIFHLEILIHSGHRRVYHFRARRRDAERRHTSGGVNHLF